jgi:hypothetical protein
MAMPRCVHRTRLGSPGFSVLLGVNCRSRQWYANVRSACADRNLESPLFGGKLRAGAANSHYRDKMFWLTYKEQVSHATHAIFFAYFAQPTQPLQSL